MTEKKTLGVGLISVGWMGKVHTKAYRELPSVYPELGVKPRLVQAADTSEERIQYAQEVLGYESGTTDYHEVLANPDVDVVSICAPNFLHREMGIAAAKAGKPFWIEKPAGRSGDETSDIAQAAAEAQVNTAVGFNYRNAPAIEHAKKIIAEGKLGRIIHVRGVFFADYSSNPKGALSWRFLKEQAGTGVLGDLMGHLVDLMHYIVAPIDEVSALTSTFYTERPILPMGQATHFAVVEDGELGPVENEDYAAMLVRFKADESGLPAVGTLEASRASSGPRARYALEIYGTEGSLMWDFERMNELEIALNSAEYTGYTRVMADPLMGDFMRFQPGAGTSMGYDDLKIIEAQKFVRALLGQDSGHATVQDAVASARVLDAAERSAVSGSWETVTP